MSGADFTRKVRIVEEMLKLNPATTLEEANAECMKREGGKLSQATFYRIKSGRRSERKEKKQKSSSVKEAMKKGTTPLAKETKQLTKTLIACGIEEAVFRMVDGVPTWQVTEKRSYML